MNNFDIVEYCKSNLNKVSITSSKQITATCPFCQKHGAFYIDIKKGDYICFKCENKGRKLIGLIAEIENIPWQEARNFLMQRAIKSRRRTTPDTLLEKIKKISGKEINKVENRVECELPPEMKKVWDGKRWRYPKYLKDRCIKKDTAKEWGLGYCERGFYTRRLIIPIDCPNGSSFTARDLTSDNKPKYKNPPNTSHSRLVHGWNQLVPGADIVLVEGPLDAIMLWQHGFNALALLGKTLHKPQFRMFSAHFPFNTSFVIMLDPEEITAPCDVAKQLSCKYDRVYVAKLPLGVDPGSSTEEQATTAINDSKPYTEHKTLALKSRLVASSSKIFDKS